MFGIFSLHKTFEWVVPEHWLFHVNARLTHRACKVCVFTADDLFCTLSHLWLLLSMCGKAVKTLSTLISVHTTECYWIWCPVLLHTVRESPFLNTVILWYRSLSVSRDVSVYVSVKTEPWFVCVMRVKDVIRVGVYASGWMHISLSCFQRDYLCEVCVCFSEWVASIWWVMQGGVNALQNVCDAVCVCVRV